jgi:transcriptional regulator with XRE-family HTH domain
MGTLTTERLQTLRVQLMAGELARQVGARIRARREELGLNQRELAEKIGEVTVNNQRVSDWERGVNQPSSRYLEKVADALGVEVAYFYTKPTETPDVIGAVSRSNGNALSDGELELLLRIEAMLRAVVPVLNPDADLPSIEARAHSALAEWRRQSRRQA